MNDNKVIYFDKIDSTNSYLKENYTLFENKSIIYSFNQTKGRGRMNREWIGSKDKNIYLSMLLKDIDQNTNISNITLFVSTIIHLILAKYIPSVTIKWPNDLLVKKKKICGILCEAVSTSNKINAIIIGIGINVNEDYNSVNNDYLATSLYNETNTLFNLESLKKEISNALYNHIDEYKDNQFLDYYKEHLFGINTNVSFIDNDITKEGIIKGIDNDGNLVLEVDSKEVIKRSGEIKIIR